MPVLSMSRRARFGHSRPVSSRRCRPRLETLEDRLAPAVSAVDPALLGDVATVPTSLTGPLTINNFQLDGNQLKALGSVALPGGLVIPFEGPVQVEMLQSTDTCRLLRLVLGPLRLELLGVRADLSRVELHITAERGPSNLLGNLLCPEDGSNAPLDALVDALNGVVVASGSNTENTATAGTGVPLLDGLDLGPLVNDQNQQGDPSECPVAHLELEKLDLNLLGVHVETFGKITLDVVALQGQGRILGNLLCDLAHLLDDVPLTESSLFEDLNTILERVLSGALSPDTTTNSPRTVSELIQIPEPIQIDSFTVDTTNNQLVANGSIVPSEGPEIPFTAPVTVEPDAVNSCNVLRLVLGPLDLDVLGLRVRLSKVDLLITAVRGEGALLGNLLCPETGTILNLDNMAQELNDVLTAVQNGTAPPPPNTAATSDGSNPLADPNLVRDLISQITRPVEPVDNPQACRILFLDLAQLDLNLLGLRVLTRGRVVLDISAEPGPGKLLGNLLCRLANLDLPQLLGELTTSPILEGATATLQGLLGGSVLRDTVTALIDWGDGVTETLTLEPGQTDFNPTHTYTRAGSFPITVTLTDSLGRTSTATATQLVRFTDPVARFLDQVYHDLLGRAVDPNGLAFFSNLLEQGKATYNQVVQMILASPEYRQTVVRNLYQDLLDRAPDPAGLEYFTNLLAQGKTLDQIRAIILGSDEFFTRVGGGTTDGFLAALYNEVLGRAIDSVGAAFWSAGLDSGLTREAVATAILSSPEEARRTVDGWYDTYLGRDADAGGLSAFTTALLDGIAEADLLAMILGSEEYRNRLG